MAESQVFSSNEHLITDPNELEKSAVDDPQCVDPDAVIILDNTTEVEEAPEEGSKDPGDTNEERVESRTTVEAYSFKCVFCEQILTGNDDPKLLECLHNACGNCISNKMYENHESESDSNQIECSQCNVSSDPSNIIENHFLLELSNEEGNNASLAEMKCSSCSDDVVATSWCVDCSGYICDYCVEAHQRLKVTREHRIKPTSANYMMFCSVHPHEKLSLFCENCDKLTCRDCQLSEHREHRYKFTTEIAAETRKSIGDMLEDVGYKRALLTSAMKVIDERQTLIVDKKQTLVKEITQLVVKLTNTINVRGKQLVSKLTEVCDNKQKTLQEKKEALELLSKMTDHCIRFTQHALDSGSNMALLFSKKQMTSHLNRIKCKRADIPNPEIPVRIHLALDKFPELVKVMSTIGQIVVDGKVYPSQPASPHTALPTSGSSPGPSRQSPISPLHPQNPPNFQQQQQVQQQQQPPPYSKMPPAYGHYTNGMQPYGQQMQMNNANNTNMQQQKMNMPNPNSLGNMLMTSTGQPISMLAQQISRMQQQRPQQQQLQQRPLLPRQAQNLGQQQVSSSTHPQGMLQDKNNLRGLLQPSSNPVYIQTGPGQYQAVQPHVAQQYQQNRYNNQYRQQAIQQQQQQQQQQLQNQANSQMRMLMNNRMQSSRQQQQQVQQQVQQQQQRQFNIQGTSGGGSARWHIPQQVAPNYRNMSLPTVNDNFRITLKQQQQQGDVNVRNLPATVTSTIPKTPSPNQRSDADCLDKYCADSVNDLIATIAKLDSNGVQVVAEGRQKTGGSPMVDSSTGDAVTSDKIVKTDPMELGKDDPNEDWCAVCMDGGELVCCDKCPKVFHQYCHIPNLSVEENDTWQCLLCTNFADYPSHLLNERKEGELSFKERKIAERIVLELYCQYDPSLPFREVIGPENVDYHSIIKTPIALDSIRQKLNWDAPEHYTSIDQLLGDVRLMFRNAYTYNPEDSLVYSDAKTLEKFFDEQLEKFLPEYAYESFDEQENGMEPPNKKFRRTITD